MKKAHLLWLIFGVIALLFLIGAASVQPGRPISQYPRVTVLQGTDIIPIARTNVIPATNMGLTGNILSNFISLVATQNIRIEAGTNVIITTNVSGQQVTYSISVTNTGSAVADGVWTNDAGIIYPKVSNGQQTNSIQVYTNGGLSIGANTLAYWGTQPGADGETMVSSRASTDDPYNEIFLRYLDGTNELHQDFFMQTGINLWTISFNDMQMRAEVDSASNYVFRATSGSDHVWRFNPASGDRYTFDTPFPVAASEALVEFGNKGTNKLTLYGGDGNLNVVGQITNQFLSASKLVKTDADKGLVSSTLDESGITNLVSTTATNNVKVTAGTNIVVVTNVSGNVVTYQVNSGIDTNIFATTNFVSARLGTNFINLSVQAAKMTGTNSPVVFGGFQTWELIYYTTNESGSIHDLSATWQFLVPPDYATNSMRVKIQSIINATNGPASSNTIFAASIFKATPGDSTDVHTGAFGAEVKGTNTWTASNTGTNKIQMLTIDMSTNSLLQPNDFAILKIASDTNSTYRFSTSVIGLQLEYSRP